MTELNYWHYIFFTAAACLFLFGMFVSFRQEKKKLVLPMAFTFTIISLFVAGFSVLVVDKYTKKVEITKLKNKRLLSTEQIVYSGIVKNTGNFKIGTVTLEIKLVNKGHATGNVKGGNFYKASGFFGFFEGLGMERSKPQTVKKEFVIATGLKPGTAQQFRVYFEYPPYFRNVAQFTKVTGN